MFHAGPAAHTLTVVDKGWTKGATDTFIYKGESSKGEFDPPDTTLSTDTYTCTADTLTYSYDGQAEVEARVSTTP
jgi:hypothetical protein